MRLSPERSNVRFLPGLPATCLLAWLFGAALLICPSGLFAQFAPGPNPITGTVGAQTLTTGTGTVNIGGAISIASGGTVALSMSGTSSLLNNGTIQTLGTGRAIDSNPGAPASDQRESAVRMVR